MTRSAAATVVWLITQTAQADHNPFIIHAPAPMHWTGYHWGGHVGLQWAEVAGDSLVDPAASASFEKRSWSAGLAFGYDREISTVVFGWTADIDLTRADIESRRRDVPIPDAGLMADSVVIATELKWLSTFRGRIGMRIDRFLPFASGGLAVAKAESRAAAQLTSLSDPVTILTVSDSGSAWVAGWAVGGGLEYRLSARDTIGVEYLYIDLPIGDASPRALDRKTAKDFTSHIVRLLFRYRF